MINIKVNPEAKRFMLQRLQRKPSHMWQPTGVLVCVISMTTIWPVSQQFSPVSVYSPAHVCTCWVSEAQNMDMQSSGLDQVYKRGGVLVFVTGGGSGADQRTCPQPIRHQQSFCGSGAGFRPSLGTGSVLENWFQSRTNKGTPQSQEDYLDECFTQKFCCCVLES